MEPFNIEQSNYQADYHWVNPKDWDSNRRDPFKQRDPFKHININETKNLLNEIFNKQRDEAFKHINENRILLNEIFNKLSERDLKNCSLVCRNWKDTLHPPDLKEKFSRIGANFWSVEGKVMALASLLWFLTPIIIPKKIFDKELTTLLAKISALSLAYLSSGKIYKALTKGETETSVDSIGKMLDSIGKTIEEYNKRENWRIRNSLVLSETSEGKWVHDSENGMNFWIKKESSSSESES